MQAVQIGPVPGESARSLPRSLPDLRRRQHRRDHAPGRRDARSGVLRQKRPRPDRSGQRAGALLVAALSPVGPRLGVPSVVAARAALGRAAPRSWRSSSTSRTSPGSQSTTSSRPRPARGFRRARLRALLGRDTRPRGDGHRGGGPRAVALADRHAVPLLAIVGVSHNRLPALFFRRRRRCRTLRSPGAAAWTS